MKNKMIVVNDRHDEDPAAGRGGISTEALLQSSSSKGEYSDLLDLTEKEQKNPIAWKWAIRDLRRLLEIENKYFTLKDEYAALDKKFAVYKAQSTKEKVYDIISSVFLTVGPIMIGLVPVTYDIEPTSIRWILLGLGLAMLGGAVYVKFITHKEC